jgi:tRNA A58 N-methylase Trm61
MTAIVRPIPGLSSTISSPLAGVEAGTLVLEVGAGTGKATAMFAALLETHSTIRVLEPGRREALVGAVAEAIERHSGALTLPLVTRVCLARRRS